jgi:hypothetical protein
LRTKLGKETEQEVFKEWFLRKSAPFVFHLYSLKTFIMDIQFNLILKQLLRKRKKVWRLIFQLD